MTVRFDYTSTRQGKNEFSPPRRANQIARQNQNLSENLDVSSAFIAHESPEIWRIELKQPVSIRLPAAEQIRQIKRQGFLAQCSDAAAALYGYDSARRMIEFAAENFPFDLLDETRLRELIGAGYILRSVEFPADDTAGREQDFSADYFGVVKNGELTQILGVRRAAEGAAYERSGAPLADRYPSEKSPSDSASKITQPTAREENSKSGNLSGSINLAGVNLLIVDDDADNLELLTLLFETLGAQVTTANSVSKALAKFQNGGRPDILISDIGMPDHDGYELIERIRALPLEQGGQTPAIALTAYTKNEDRLLALSKGFQLHVKKPVEPADLARRVSELLGHS